MKFVDELPSDGRSRAGHPPIDLDALRAAPGRWAEVQSLPKAKRSTLTSRGNYFTRRNEGTEYTVRTVGDELVLFVRAVAP